MMGGWCARMAVNSLYSAQTGGVFPFRCSMQLFNGQLVGWEAGERDYPGGGIEIVPHRP